jgi:hypothetical protein
MNVKPIFLPSISSWKVSAYMGEGSSFLFKKSTPMWDDCREKILVQKGRYSDNPMDPIETYEEEEFKLLTFPTYEKVLEWINEKGLTLCDDKGKPISVNTNTNSLNTTYRNE